MAVFNGAFPTLEGKTDAARAFAGAIAGNRKAEFTAMQQRAGVSRETWSMQETPAGAFMLVWFEGNVEHAFEDLATANDGFTQWFRAQIQDVTGLDMTQPADGGPELLLEWSV